MIETDREVAHPDIVQFWRGMRALRLEAPSSVMDSMDGLAKAALTAARKAGREEAISKVEHFLRVRAVYGGHSEPNWAGSALAKLADEFATIRALPDTGGVSLGQPTSVDPTTMPGYIGAKLP
jgi:hypothetical protein